MNGRLMNYTLEFSQLKDLTMALIDKTNNDSQPSSSQSPSKQPQIGRDMVTGVTETRSTRRHQAFQTTSEDIRTTIPTKKPIQHQEAMKKGF